MLQSWLPLVRIRDLTVQFMAQIEFVTEHLYHGRAFIVNRRAIYVSEVMYIFLIS